MNGARRSIGFRRAAGFCARFEQCRRGAAAVEFALLAVPFLALVFLMLNTALVFFAQQSLQTATTQAARLVMTGQAQSAGTSAAQFQQALCNNLSGLFTCSGIYVSIQTFSTFSAVNAAPAPTSLIQNGTFNSAGMPYSLGNKGDIELIQVFYQWPLFATNLGFNFANVNGGSDLLIASAAFRNEPF
jgi:Flp pilus assembly protein TadG